VCYCNKIPEIGYHLKTRHLFPTVLGAGSTWSRCTWGPILFLLGWSLVADPCPHMAEEQKWTHFLQPLYKDLNHIMRALSSLLNQLNHLKLLSSSPLNIATLVNKVQCMDFWGEKPSFKPWQVLLISRKETGNYIHWHNIGFKRFHCVLWTLLTVSLR
jgi:hypothetical protein